MHQRLLALVLRKRTNQQLLTAIITIKHVRVSYGEDRMENVREGGEEVVATMMRSRSPTPPMLSSTDNQEEEETCSLVNGGDGSQTCIDDKVKSTPTKESMSTKSILLVGILCTCGFAWLGYEGGSAFNHVLYTRLVSSDDNYSTSIINDKQEKQQHMRGPEMSMTDATARDVALHKKEQADEISSTINVDDIEDLTPEDKTLLDYLLRSSYARSKTIQLLTNEYISEESTDIEMSDRLEDTIEAMDLVVSDGDPVQVEGYPFLFVGSVGASMNEESLKQHGITHVISWSATAKCNNFGNMHYMCITDVSDYIDMKKHLDDRLNAAVDYIESARKAGGRVLSQCWYGRNRSVTLLVAYLIKYEGYEGEDALHLIQKTRPIADSYRDVIYKYGNKYGSAYNGSKKAEGNE